MHATFTIARSERMSGLLSFLACPAAKPSDAGTPRPDGAEASSSQILFIGTGCV